MPFVLILFVIVYFAINGWIALWFWRSLAGKTLWRVVVPLCMLGLAISFPVLYWKAGTALWELTLLRAGSVWAGVFFYVFLMVCLVQIAGRLRRALSSGRSARNSGPRPRLAAAILAATAVLAITGWVNATFMMQLSEVRISVPVPASETGDSPWKPGDSLTIAAISDVHLGRLVSTARLNRAISLVLPHNPDIVCFAGDVLDDHVVLDRPGMAAAVARLNPPLGVWAIAGNHEYYSGEIGESLSILEEIGMTVLRDTWATPGGKLLLVGRDDYSNQRFTGEHRPFLDTILRSIPEAERAWPLIVLDHQPISLKEAEQAGAVLQISGHTHNAQLWPFNYITDAIYENPRGLSQRGATHYFVSVGAGTWGPPLRNNARPEAVLISLEFVAND